MAPRVVLPRAFYDRPTLSVARDLLGKVLVHDLAPAPKAGRIIEVEAYVGPHDRASHASRGRTARTSVMFGPPGVAYVYLVYGIHFCFNVVTERDGYPAAVLVRGVQPQDPSGTGRADLVARGPGLVCRQLGIGKAENSLDLTDSRLRIEDWGMPPEPESVSSGSRVGVTYAGQWASRPWRLYVSGTRFHKFANVFQADPGRGARE